ncbi:MAG TPA: non-canonical purine NTP pyrophosphatase [Candidatus Saccharimonadales bacterium]|nr:non-canonical purine NTP pyrophosphatase [Candidatus Saccharimonadales bacterium]
MQRIPVESSDLVSVGYDPKTRVLEIEFKENRLYQYLEVETDIYERFMRADSYGQYFFANINGRYRYSRVRQVGEETAKPGILAFVTGNSGKVRGLSFACEPLGIEFEQLDLPVDEIQSHDLEDIAVKKAKQAYRLAGRSVLVNDTFWGILALKGFPGAYMSYVADWFKPEDFLALLSGKNDRTVSCTDTLVYYDGQRSKVFSKTYYGKLAEEPRGNGVSIDQLVVMDGQTKTNAELTAQGRSGIPTEDGIYQEFAKWYNLQRRLRKV